MGHVVLLGDSIFDNARYVPDRPAVIEQLQKSLPREWLATLLAVDGHTTSNVASQLQRLPRDATHLIISVGGNDALGESNILDDRINSVGEALEVIHGVKSQFAKAYRRMLSAVSNVGKPIAVCTVYEAIPDLPSAARTALAEFNDVILREAIRAGLPVIDLRFVCDSATDYSHISPIEPSHLGGAKIAGAIAGLLATHDFSQRRTAIYT